MMMPKTHMWRIRDGDDAEDDLEAEKDSAAGETAAHHIGLQFVENASHVFVIERF